MHPKNKPIKLSSAVAPGKIILSGEHAVVYGRPALAIAVNYLTETTIGTNNTQCITFYLENFNHKFSTTYHFLRQLKCRVVEKYQRFILGNYLIKNILKTPAELAQIALIYVLEKFKVTLSQGLDIRIHSSIPVGCGLGSSAAMILSLLYAAAHYFQIAFNKENFWQLALDIERLQHGYSSGLDLQTSLQGGCVFFQPNHMQNRPLPKVAMYLVNTGQPETTTGACVEHVGQCYPKHHPLWNEFETVTKAMNTCLDHVSGSINEAQAIIRNNHDLLTQIGVVPQKIQAFIGELAQQGAAGKICGAGAVTGESAGIILIVTDSIETIIPVCRRYHYPLFPLNVQTAGVHLKEK